MRKLGWALLLLSAAGAASADVPFEAAIDMGALSAAMSASVQRSRQIMKKEKKESPVEKAIAAVKADLAVVNPDSDVAVPDEYVEKAFHDRRTRLYSNIPALFKNWGYHPVGPGTPYSVYKKNFVTAANAEAGAAFYREHRELLEAVQDKYRVDAALLVAIVSRETYYGKFVGSYDVFNALNTIIQRVPVRAAWATHEEAELLKMAYAQGLDPHEVVGTYDAGLGFVQFEPSSFNKYAVDTDKDGKIRLNEWPDAFASAADFLILDGGYTPGDKFEPDSSIGRAIWSYNHSENYVRAILELRGEIAARVARADSKADR